jgi:hypothetical protein
MKTMHRSKPLAAMLALAVAAGACTDDYEEKFLNPERSTRAEVPYLFTHALIAAEFQVGYWEAYYRIYRNVSRWGQLTGTANSETMMNQDPSQWDAFWQSYYTDRAATIREMDVVRARQPDPSRFDIYVTLGKIVHAYNTHLITDVWGDMPYSEAFTARESDRNLFPRFDSQEAVYDAMLADLKEAADALRGGSLHVHSQLATQDVFLGGDLQAWQRFANSLRLRLAMRLAQVAPNKAQAIVQEILGGTNYPVVESNAQNIIWRTMPDHGGDDRGQPTRESQQLVYAPKVMMDLMNAASDPRIPVFFAPNAQGNYVGLPSSPDAQSATGLDITRANFAHLRPDLWENHPTYPGFVITAAEVWFLKAEAYQRGWAQGDAAAAHARALRESVLMYYELHNSNPGRDNAPTPTPFPVPSEAALTAFATTGAAAFNGTLQRIAEQKWVHLGFNQPYEAWAEQRRTGFPNLGVDRFGGAELPRTVRITYPSSELTNNRQSYQEVQAKDTPVSRVWWHVN